MIPTASIPHKNDILALNGLNEIKFREYALEVFQFQKNYNHIYAQWVDLLAQSDKKINFIEDIPFLPIQLFKSHQISCFNEHEITFSSSSTTGVNPSLHPIHQESDYIETCKMGFKMAFGTKKYDYIAALLPSYLDRSGSGLIHMVSQFIADNNHRGKFYNREFQLLVEDLERLSHQGQNILLFGVTFGLLELLKFPNQIDWSKVEIIETGGMKGQGKELVRSEFHQILTQSFHGVRIHSEYGMTELTSQAYALNGSYFKCPPWMKILIQDADDPFNFTDRAKTGRICVIDLMNYHSCSFIATDDLGRIHTDGSFEVLGRFDHAEIRGCNQLMI